VQGIINVAEKLQERTHHSCDTAAM